jgi:YidC/Oxa1 family membrane protein insertase
MDNQRLILFILFTFSVFFLMEGWQKEKQPAPVSRSEAPVPASGPVATPVPSPSAPQMTAPAAAPPGGGAALQKGETVHVETDVFVAEIDSAGGDLRRLELREHRDTLDQKKNFVLLQQQANHVYIAQSGLIGTALPNHRTLYVTNEHELKLADGADKISVRLTGPATNGVKVVKVYTFHRGSYVIDVGYELENQGTTTVQADAYFQLIRDGHSPDGDSAMLPTYTGMAVYNDKDKFQKIAFTDVDKGKAAYTKKSNDGWIAFLQHYFLSAWLPANGAPREFYTRVDNGIYAAGVILSLGNIEPGARGALTVPLYAGPQEQDQLAKLAPGLDLTVDYGWLTVVAKPLFWFLQWLHQWVGNWGIAIILLTVTIKAIFYPLSATSYRSMARMRVLAPKLQKLKEQYGEDRQRMNQAMMELYKTEKINPLGGCLPIVIQIPVFIALYWVLLASVELRHVPFMWGIDDLSMPAIRTLTPLDLAPFVYFVLPVLMGATMIFQTYLNPAPPDPVQAKVMKIMPIAFSIMFFWFPVGLVLYWLVNNILSIAQQWQITRSTERANQPAHGK